MPSSVFSIALAVTFVLTPVVVGRAPAMSQDFSITNQLDPVDASRRDLLKQLQAWWDNHAYYPKHASNNDEAGTVKVHLVIHSDGVIWISNTVEGSGSRALDTAAAAAFQGGFVRPFPPGVQGTELDVSVHYVLAFQHGQPVASGPRPSSSRPFTITNQPVQSPILETMMQKNCAGTVVKQGIRNRPWYGVRFQVEAVFFRKPDGTAWVRLYDSSTGYSIAPIVEVGKVLRWTGPAEHIGSGNVSFTEYTAWAEGANLIIGNIVTNYFGPARANMPLNRGGTVDLTCATETVPAITWSALAVTPGQSPPGDPP